MNLQELSANGGQALFRDGNQALHVLEVAASKAHLLAERVQYAQWAPGCHGVVVAQAPAGDVLVWYDTHQPEPCVMQLEGQVLHLTHAKVSG